MSFCPHGYLYNLERDPLGMPNRKACDGCAPPDYLVKRREAYEAVGQAAYDLEVAVEERGRRPGDPLDCAMVLAARASELVAILKS